MDISHYDVFLFLVVILFSSLVVFKLKQDIYRLFLQAIFNGSWLHNRKHSGTKFLVYKINHIEQMKRRDELPSGVLEDFKDRDIAKLWYEGKRVKRLPSYLGGNELLNILQILNDIKHPLELRNLLPPKSKVRQIKWGQRKGQWKFNLDKQFRVIFTWQEKSKKIICLEVGEFHDE